MRNSEWKYPAGFHPVDPEMIRSPFDPPNHHMMERPWRVYSCLTWHSPLLFQRGEYVKMHELPHFHTRVLPNAFSDNVSDQSLFHFSFKPTRLSKKCQPFQSVNFLGSLYPWGNGDRRFWALSEAIFFRLGASNGHAIIPFPCRPPAKSA